MGWLALLWPISGWFFCWIATPYWMRRKDPRGFVIVLVFCGSIAGPAGLLWVLLDPITAQDRRWNEEARREDRERKP